MTEMLELLRSLKQAHLNIRRSRAIVCVYDASLEHSTVHEIERSVKEITVRR